ncbi:MAG TPA: ABATE domain-containing protein [Ktedonobacteraceae bacterium]|nr:ABATE domain-containing protein [Ktedonobacteraceae bacterium]
MAEMDIDIPDFDNVPGNWLCLDFTHTLANRYNPDRRELLHSYRDLLAWGLYMRLVTEEEVQQLLHVAEQRPREASTTTEDAVRLREAIYRVFYAIVEDSEPRQDDMALLNAMLAQAMSHARVEAKENGYSWSWDTSESVLNLILWHVVRSAADLLTSEKLRDVRACSAEDCRWLFLDISKNHSRRWCDMQTCGNQAKARRHYQRQRVQS